MDAHPRDRLAHLLRVAACLLLPAAVAAARSGRVLGFGGPASAGGGFRLALPPPRLAAALVVLLASAVLPLVSKSRVLRTALLALDVVVLGLWSGLFLSTARLVGWAAWGPPPDAAELAAALLLLATAFLFPLCGRRSHYCLHVCPFGAAQELAGRLPVRKPALPPGLVRALAAFRRGLWAALMLAAWTGVWARWMDWELFGAFAWRAVPPLVLALALSFLVLAAFVPRPYCRFVCPTGTLFKLADPDPPTPASKKGKRPMKASGFLNAVLAGALVLVCAKLHFAQAAADPVPVAPDSAIVIDSTGLAPDVRGFGGPVPVEVRVRDGVVERVSPKLPNDETPAFFKRLDDAGLWNAWNGLPVEVAVTARVDAVTSATYSSAAAIANVRAALSAAAGASERNPAENPGADADVVRLPKPARDAMPLGEALERRRTDREFDSGALTDQELSDLLWAANGYNRPEERKRTAPTAINRQEIDLYVCRADGAWLWDPGENLLRRVCTNDLRGLTGRMNAGSANFALAADVALVYVIDFERQNMRNRPQDSFKYASVDCGFVGQNVYLHCAAAGLNTVFLGSIDPAKLSEALGLPPERVPLFAQTVGKRP